MARKYKEARKMSGIKGHRSGKATWSISAHTECMGERKKGSRYRKA